ncbi:hypothetical protein AK812_SmicGene5893 [Symbiodinium microadriaticum]|uniref:Uncharacterized protein n=1 Tax=Symbiodinium microadriaticum TaxID=2951 RepID=A0A1Q9ESK6_SYMMI|nr:hypothetical protein AK812_SmicGene5893 [Symbiodinium microadriaticum]
MGDGGAEATATYFIDKLALRVGGEKDNRIGSRGLELLMDTVSKDYQGIPIGSIIDWPERILENLVTADREGAPGLHAYWLLAIGARTKGICGFGDRCWNQHGDTFDSAMSFGSLSPRFATMVQMEEV